MQVDLSDSDLLINTQNSFILCGLVRSPFTLFIETTDDEYCQYLETGDLIAISAPEGGALRQAGILLELVRTWHAPLIVLPPGHPGSRRLQMVVSAGKEIVLNCEIQRGTHPEQTVLCSSSELAGMSLYSHESGVRIENMPVCAELFLVLPDGSTKNFDSYDSFH